VFQSIRVFPATELVEELMNLPLMGLAAVMMVRNDRVDAAIDPLMAKAEGVLQKSSALPRLCWTGSYVHRSEAKRISRRFQKRSVLDTSYAADANYAAQDPRSPTAAAEFVIL